VLQARPALVGKQLAQPFGEHRVEAVNGERYDQKTSAQHLQLQRDRQARGDELRENGDVKQKVLGFSTATQTPC